MVSIHIGLLAQRLRNGTEFDATVRGTNLNGPPQGRFRVQGQIRNTARESETETTPERSEGARANKKKDSKSEARNAKVARMLYTYCTAVQIVKGWI